VGVTPLNCTLGRYPNGISAACKRGGFVLQRATKLAKELIAQNPPQDRLQTRATSGLVFATCKRGGFVLQRATKPAKEQIAQNPPQDCLQTRAISGLVFEKQVAAADVAGRCSGFVCVKQAVFVFFLVLNPHS